MTPHSTAYNGDAMRHADPIRHEPVQRADTATARTASWGKGQETIQVRHGCRKLRRQLTRAPGGRPRAWLTAQPY